MGELAAFEGVGESLGGILQALQAAAAALVELRSAERLSTVLESAVHQGLGAELLVLALLDEDGDHLRAAHPGRRVSADVRGLIVRVARSGRPVYRVGAAEEDRTLHAIGVRPSALPSIAAVPLPGSHGAVGVMVLERRREFSAEDIAFLVVIAAMSGLAVQRRRRRRRLAVDTTAAHMHAGRMLIDIEQLQIDVDGRTAHLTPTEMRLLMFLAEEPGRPRTREEILRHLWHTDHVGGERTCDAHISNLRRKIEQNPSRPELVVTRRGIGYALDLA